MEPRLVELIASGACRVRLSPPLQRLAAALACVLAEKGVTVVSGIDVPNSIPCEEAARAQGRRYALLWCDSVAVPEDSIVFAAGVQAGIRGLRVLKCRQVGSSTYLLEGCGMREIVSVHGCSVRRAELEREVLEALEAVRDAYREYGALRLSDAATVIAARLGVKRGKAREVLVKLARLGLVRVSEGYVIVDEG